MHIILKGKPISTQHAYGKRGRITYMKKEAKELKNSYILQTRLQYKGKPLEGPIEIKIQLFFNDRHVRDWDNWHKLSMDSLSKIVFDDDSQIKKSHSRNNGNRQTQSSNRINYKPTLTHATN